MPSQAEKDYVLVVLSSAQETQLSQLLTVRLWSFDFWINVQLIKQTLKYDYSVKTLLGHLEYNIIEIGPVSE